MGKLTIKALEDLLDENGGQAEILPSGEIKRRGCPSCKRKDIEIEDLHKMLRDREGRDGEAKAEVPKV